MAKSYAIQTNSNIGQLVREAENDWNNGYTTSSKYVKFNLAEKLNKIDAYLNSKHTTGETDSLNREKPFFNIVTAAVNIWYRSTDIDRSFIKIKARNTKDVLRAFSFETRLQNWMRKENFGSFLNDWGRALARYGSAIVKFIKKDGRLIPIVIPWQRLIVDSVDFDSNIKIELLDLTEAQLRKHEGYDKDMVNKLCTAAAVRKTAQGESIDLKSGYIRLYEVHGDLPLSLLTGKDEDNDIYTQQMHVISFLASKEAGDFDDYTLISGKEEQEPNMLTHLIREDGQTLSIGAVEHLFEAQWMMNHTVKAIKDQLDLASKLIFQTSDPAFVGQNVLSSIETGDIMIHKTNEPLTKIDNAAHDITGLQSFGNQWKALSNEITGISESMLGNAAPSGTAWRQVEALLQQNQSLFELMTENKALYVEEMMRRFIIPYIRTQMNSTEEISAVLDQNDLQRIDNMYIPREAAKRLKRKAIDALVKGQMPDTNMQGEMANVQGELSQLGNVRYFKPSDLKEKTWKEYFKGFEEDCEIDITGEDMDKNAMDTLNTMLTTIARNPNILQDKRGQFIFNKILMNTGVVSPMEISSLAPAPTPSPVQLANPMVGKT